MEGRRRGRLACALLAAVVLAGCSQAAGPKSSTGTTAPDLGRVLKPSGVRTAQVYAPSGRSATKGLIDSSPSREGGLPLNILEGLESDGPIYDGDFADPTALPDKSTLYFYASSSQASKYDPGANVPVIALPRGARLLGSLHRRRAAEGAHLVGAGVSVGP